MRRGRCAKGEGAGRAEVAVVDRVAGEVEGAVGAVAVEGEGAAVTAAVQAQAQVQNGPLEASQPSLKCKPRMPSFMTSPCAAGSPRAEGRE